MCHLTTRNILGLRTKFSEACKIFPGQESFLGFEEGQVESSVPLKSFVENDGSRFQHISPMPDSSTSIANQELYGEFRTRTGHHVEVVERYGWPIENSEIILFVECFSCEEFFLAEVRMSEPRVNWLALMTKEFNSSVENETWKLCELPQQ